jgi:hypothetical protein
VHSIGIIERQSNADHYDNEYEIKVYVRLPDLEFTYLISITYQ